MADRTKEAQPAHTSQTLFSPRDVAQFFRVHYYTVRDLRHAGRIPAPDLFIGNRPRWKWDTIMNLIEKRHI